jgi:hypothetical protein
LKRVYRWAGPGKGLIEITNEVGRIPENKAPAVWADIEPYEFIGKSHKGDFEIVTSRSRHREVLKEGGYIEVGNEMPKSVKSAIERERERNGR